MLQQKIQRQVSDFFATLTTQIKSIEKDVMNHIQNSQSLAKLKEALSNLHFKLNNKDIDRLEEEKKTVDVRVETQRYAFVAQRKVHYTEVEQDLDNLNQFLAENVAAAKKHAVDLFSIKYAKGNLFN